MVSGVVGSGAEGRLRDRLASPAHVRAGTPRSHMRTLEIYKLGFNQNYYTSTTVNFLELSL